MLRAILWSTTHSLRKATVIAANVGRFIAFLFIVWGVRQIFSGNVGSGRWIAFIGWVRESVATAQVPQQYAGGLLAEHTVSAAMNPHVVGVSAGTPLRDLVDHHILESGDRRVMLVQDGETVGLLTAHQIPAVPRDKWSVTSVADVMTPIADVKRVGPTTGWWAATTEMELDGVNQLPVTADGRVLGMLTRGDVIGYLRTLHRTAH